ncbi:MAG TPA: hypothetical protein VFE41_07725 [Acetobacteraceae bacterium]|nr:hypothetical protein [Acetobacteraceae bacterium]
MNRKLLMTAAFVAIALIPSIGIGTAAAHGGGFHGGRFRGGGIHGGGFHEGGVHDRGFFWRTRSSGGGLGTVACSVIIIPDTTHTGNAI